MKKTLLATLSFFSAVVASHATTMTFTPSTGDLNDLDHHTAVTWGITWSAIPAGEVITSAKIKINNLWDWQVEDDRLWIHLLDDPKSGVKSYADNTNDTELSDYFGGQGILLTTFTDPAGGNNGHNSTNFVYSFNASQIATLTSYITDTRSFLWSSWEWSADFGLAFDPDCHYYNTGVSFEITTGPAPAPTVPDSGSTLGLLGLGVLGLAIFQRTRSR